MSPEQRAAATAACLAAIRSEPGAWNSIALCSDLDIDEFDWPAIAAGIAAERCWRPNSQNGVYWPWPDPVSAVVWVVAGAPYSSRSFIAERVGVTPRTITPILKRAVQEKKLRKIVQDGSSNVRYVVRK